MAGELQFSNGPGHTGDTIYFRLYDANGKVWNGTAFETFVDANIADYDIAAVEQGTASGLFIGTMPAASAGVYAFDAWVRAGDDPAVSDVRAGSGTIQWSGSVELGLDDISTLGSGASANTYTVTDGTDPLDGVAVWVTTDEAGSNVVASGTSNSSGQVTFMLDAGTTYYIWRQLSGYNFTNPDEEEAA
jgi:hypothetical protein